MSTKLPERRRVRTLTTVGEAAYVAGVSKHAVNQAIDRREIHSQPLRRRSDRASRGIGASDLVYLRAHRVLSGPARKELHRRIAGVEIEAVPTVIELEGSVKMDLGDVVAEIRERLRELERMQEMVEENPEVRGGEPVFRGTRVPVHMIAEFIARGVPESELLEDYPALTAEALSIARDYAQLYPRRGRPRHAPWRSAEPSHVFRPGDLDGPGA